MHWNGSIKAYPEFGTKNGRVDFYIPSKRWGVELRRPLCEGDQLVEHSSQFARSQAYGRDLLLDDYIILDCCTLQPEQSHYRMCVICPLIHFPFFQAKLTHRISKIVSCCIQQGL